MKLARLAALAIIGSLGMAAGAQAPSPWQQPAAALAGRIADLLGPGQAHFTLRNLSSLPAGDLPAIRKLLAEDLRARGVTLAGADSANAIRVTLSENATEKLWIAEVMEGDDTQVAIVDAGPATRPQTPPAGAMALRSVPVFSSPAPVLAALDMPGGLAVLEPQEIAIYAQTPAGWRKAQSFPVAGAQLARDPRGILRASVNGQGFEAWLPGAHCTGSLSTAQPPPSWTVDCHASDDPWLLSSGSASPVSPSVVAPALPAQLPGAEISAFAASAMQTPTLRAFYNAARNYFTGVIVPNPAVNIPPFYTAAFIPRPAGGEALLIGGIDGKVQLLENGALSPLGGARDWGSDFAALYSGCSAHSQFGMQIVASASGQAINDSLRAYDVPALEATAASAPLTMSGTVTALWTAPDGRSDLAVVRMANDQYEVDRVSATCN